MAYLKTVVVAVALAALCAQLSAGACICSGGSRRSSYSDESEQAYAGESSPSCAGESSQSYAGDSSEASGDASAAVAAADNSWTNIPTNAIITSHSINDNSCDCCEIRMPDEASLPIGIVQSRPQCAQHLSYDIEVPAEQARPIVPSYHSVSVEVPIRQRSPVAYNHLPYSVEVPVEQNVPCQKLENLNVQIAVPVRQRTPVSYSHLPYSVEVPAEERGCTRLTNLRAQVDRVVLPRVDTCLPPNNGPAPVSEVRYVAVPAGPGVCPSPVGLLGLPQTSGTFNYGVSSEAVAASGASSASGSSSGCRCPCDD